MQTNHTTTTLGAKQPIKETLTFRRKNVDGTVDAIHAWATGFQELTFNSQAHFDRAKSKF